MSQTGPMFGGPLEAVLCLQMPFGKAKKEELAKYGRLRQEICPNSHQPITQHKLHNVITPQNTFPVYSKGCLKHLHLTLVAPYWSRF